MVFSIDLKIIKIDLDHLSKLEIIKSRIICPEGKNHDFRKIQEIQNYNMKIHLFFFLASRESSHFLGLPDWEFMISRSLDEITFF